MKWKKNRVTAPLCGNSQVTGEFPSQRPVMRSLGIFFYLRLNKRLSKKSRRQWLHTIKYVKPICKNVHKMIYWNQKSLFGCNRKYPMQPVIKIRTLNMEQISVFVVWVYFLKKLSAGKIFYLFYPVHYFIWDKTAHNDASAPGKELEGLTEDSPIAPFHKDFSPGGEQLEHRKWAHELWQPTADCIAIFHKYFYYTKRGGIRTNLTMISLEVRYRRVKIPQCGYMEHGLKDIAF